MTSPSDPLRQLLLFFGASYAVTWAVLAAYILAGGWATDNFGPMRPGSPSFYVAVAAPSMAALALTLWQQGLSGVSGLLRRLLPFPVPPIWAAAALLGYPMLWLIVVSSMKILNGELGVLDLSPWTVALPAVLLGGHLLKDGGALGEELGWRGYALPRLLEISTPRTASVVLGLAWAVWHLPAFFVGSLSQSTFSLGPYILNVVAFSVFMTVIFIKTNGNVLWAGIVPHMMFNAVPRAGIEVFPAVTIVLGALVLLFCGPSLGGGKRPTEGGSS